MIKFLSLEILGLSHRIPRKIKNAVYSVKTSALVLDLLSLKIFSLKYANKMTDDIIHSNPL